MGVNLSRRNSVDMVFECRSNTSYICGLTIVKGHMSKQFNKIKIILLIKINKEYSIANSSKMMYDLNYGLRHHILVFPFPLSECLELTRKLNPINHIIPFIF